MTDEVPRHPRLTPKRVALLAEAAGITISPERLPDATAALTEFFVLEAVLDDLELSDIDPSTDDVSWPGFGS